MIRIQSFSFYPSKAGLDITQAHTMIYDRQFTSIDSEIYYITNPFTVPRFNCDHVLVDDTYTQYEIESYGGCTTKYFDAQQCQKVVIQKIKELTHEVTYHVGSIN